jgi:MFS family permease
MKHRLGAMGINREIVVLSAARMADAFCNSLLIVLLPLYVAQIPRSGVFARMPEEVLIGILISLAGLMFAVMQPVAAAVSDRSGRRKPFIVVGLAILALATIAYIPARSYTALVVLRVIQGFGIAFTIPTALALISAYSEEGRVGTAMGVFTTARMIGFAVGPLTAGVLMVKVSYNAAFITGALGAVTSLLLVVLMVPEVRDTDAAGAIRRGASVPKEPGEQPAAGAVESERDHRRSVMRQVYILGFSAFVMAISISLMAAVEPELNRRLGQTAIGFGVAFSMLTIGRFLVQIPVGHWSDQIGRKRLIVAGLIAMIPLTIFQGYAPTTFWLSVDRFLLGVATAAIVAPGYAMVSDLALPGMLVRQMSVITMSFGLGVATGPMVSGLLAGTVGFEVPFLAGGAVSLIATIIVVLYVRETIPATRHAHV